MPKHTITTRVDPEFPYRRWFYAESITSSPDEEYFAHCARVVLEMDESYALVSSLFVPARSRGKGVGATLMNALIERHTRIEGAKANLFLNATPFGYGRPKQPWLVRWYQKFGFSRCYQPSGAFHPFAMVL